MNMPTEAELERKKWERITKQVNKDIKRFGKDVVMKEINRFIKKVVKEEVSKEVEKEVKGEISKSVEKSLDNNKEWQEHRRNTRHGYF